MNKSIFIFILMLTSASFSQEKEDLKAIKKANNYVYQGNTLLADKEDFVSAEMAYRKAISEQPTTTAGLYNLGNSYFKSKNHEEALYRLEQAASMATSKDEKHKAYHNMGNILMKSKRCKEAVEVYKSALRNNPTDDETRYNLALAKECAEQQKDQNNDNKDKGNEEEKDENKDKEDNNEDNKDEGDKDKKEGDDKEDEEGKPQDDKDNKGKEDPKDQQPPKPQPGQLSPQQIKNLLEAMNNQEQKVQEKVNAEKQKGVKVKTDKDW